MHAGRSFRENDTVRIDEEAFKEIDETAKCGNVDRSTAEDACARFENMINYYKDELQVIFKSQDEYTAIAGLSKTVRNTLALNKITTGWGRNNQLTAKARGYLLLDN